jgi:hypothetical protein
MGDLNIKIGNQGLGKIKGTNKEPIVNNNKKPTALCCFKVFKNFPTRSYLQIYVDSTK